MHPHMSCYTLINLALSQLQAMCWHWADQRCPSSHKHELIWLWRHHKSLSGHSWGLPAHLRRVSDCSHYWRAASPQTTDGKLRMEIPSLCCLSVVALMSLCSLQIRGSALPSISLRIRVTLVNDLYWTWPYVNSCVWLHWDDILNMISDQSLLQIIS